MNVFWFRRDLRLSDNHALFEALKSDIEVLPIFIFDTDILDKLSDKADVRVQYIHTHLELINTELFKYQSSIKIHLGKPIDVFENLIIEYQLDSVYVNHDYEPYGMDRDEKIKTFLQTKGIDFKSFKDQVIFEKDEITKPDGSPYTVFTPYSKKWKMSLTNEMLTRYQSNSKLNKLSKTNHDFPSLEEIGFQASSISQLIENIDDDLLANYDKNRNIPSISGTSLIGTALRFGTISLRELVQKAIKYNEVYLNELIWREFFMQIIFHFPHSATKNFRSKYDRILWRNNEKEFISWCKGETGYPIVDAGMRELNATGFMHNRVRMITASFLCKHLLIDWRWGEAYFASKLLDFEQSSNVGNWQWVAGTGCDAAPYFRVFNPIEQAKKFDPENLYIRKWVPEFDQPHYDQPIVDHAFARNRALETYKKALSPFD